MNRITRMTPKGAALVMAESYESQADVKKDLGVRFRKALEKLYQYETLGLEPEEIYDLIQSTEAYRSLLNKKVTWASPFKGSEQTATLDAVKIRRDIKTGKLRVSAELLVGKQRNLIVADIKHIKELKSTEL